MPSLDTLVALSSAYLDRHLLARAESASRAYNQDDTLRSYLDVLFSMLIYHLGYGVDALLRRVAFCASTKAEIHPDFIQNDAENLAKDLQSILNPYLQALINTAALKRPLNPLAYTSLWEDKYHR